MITQKEIEAIERLDPSKRFIYTLKRICDFEEVWVLYNENEGYCVNVEDNGDEFLPIWAFKEFSDKWISGDFKIYHSKALDIYEFKDTLLPKLRDNNINLLVAPTATGKGFIISITDFEIMLNEELSQYE